MFLSPFFSFFLLLHLQVHYLIFVGKLIEQFEGEEVPTLK